MGLGKLVFLIVAPIGGMAFMAFSLKRNLPVACRWLGNYIGLSYVYFKSLIKIMKPQDHMTYQMIDIARRTSQQSQALRRQLKNTLKKVKQQFKVKQQQTLNQLYPEKSFDLKQNNESKTGFSSQNTQSQKQNVNNISNKLLIEMEYRKKKLLSEKLSKLESKKFVNEL